MSKPSKNAVPIIVVGTIIACLGVFLLATHIVESDENETWSGWVQAIGSIGAISVGWIVALWQREEEDERKLADRHDTAAVVGWRIFSVILQVRESLREEFKVIKAQRHAMISRKIFLANPPFNRLDIPDVLLSAWPDFQHFPGEIGPALAQTLGRVETYNQNADISRKVRLDYLEGQQRMVFSMYRSLRSVHADLGTFLEEDRVRRSKPN
jgi:hypothetical protein